ncbi:serine/threonine protein kinase [Streptomyces sp. NPDC018955]|uniref:serine/threonine protein kinase n=1 Tax=Streptomyces sp. NPDC018955 TaxID=3365055 RepID=UPI003788FBD2
MRGRARGEYEWALEVVGRLQVPEQAGLDEVIALVARQVGRPLAAVPVDAPVANGALEEGLGGVLWIRVPAGVSGSYRQHLVCRGLARALYREADARHGQIDYTHAVEREIEYAATVLSARLAHGD